LNVLQLLGEVRRSGPKSLPERLAKCTVLAEPQRLGQSRYRRRFDAGNLCDSAHGIEADLLGIVDDEAGGLLQFRREIRVGVYQQSNGFRIVHSEVSHRHLFTPQSQKRRGMKHLYLVGQILNHSLH
jgi:hypothetical protein